MTASVMPPPTMAIMPCARLHTVRGMGYVLESRQGDS